MYYFQLPEFSSNVLLLGEVKVSAPYVPCAFQVAPDFVPDRILLP
jgi:hypothetical protein